MGLGFEHAMQSSAANDPAMPNRSSPSAVAKGVVLLFHAYALGALQRHHVRVAAKQHLEGAWIPLLEQLAPTSNTCTLPPMRVMWGSKQFAFLQTPT